MVDAQQKPHAQPKWWTKCDACNGTGERYADPRGDENGRGLKPIRCPVCRGRGQVPYGR